MFEKIGLKLLRKIDAETAHNIALLYLGLKPFCNNIQAYPSLKIQLAGLNLPNPIGLAAGFDKNAIAIKTLSQLGFGFLEVGAVTPRAQPGNLRPRVFRVEDEEAIVNHYGFNNDGMEIYGHLTNTRGSSYSSRDRWSNPGHGRRLPNKLSHRQFGNS